MTESLKIHKDDKRQYSTIAYSLRSLLAVQQDLLLNDRVDDFLPLDESATDTLTEALDFYLLSVLQISDREARSKNQHEVSVNLLENVWKTLFTLEKNVANAILKNDSKGTKRQAITPHMFNRVVEQKVRSYSQYNELNNQIFVRNLQVFFARHRWPQDSVEATQFRQLFTEEVINFAGELYTGAQKMALQNGRNVIIESDVYQYAQSVLPHEINEYEDAIFFPSLPAQQQVTIEAYDMDAFPR